MVGKNMSEIGKKYGKLTVIKKLERKEHQTTVYLCRCDCGNFKEVNINKLHIIIIAISIFSPTINLYIDWIIFMFFIKNNIISICGAYTINISA